MSRISTRTMIYALLLSAVMHGFVLFDYAADETVVDASETQSATVQVELMPHVAAAPVEKIASHHVATQQKAHAGTATESEQIVESSDVEAEALAAQPKSTNNSNHEQFVSLLHQAIDKHKRYPYQAKRQRREGLVKLQFVVHPDGQVTNVSVVESSRFDALDNAARDAVNAISPFQLAENYINEQKIYDVDIAFRLN